MKYKCCDALLHKLAINPDNINFCCSPYDNKLQYLNNYNGEVIDIADYRKRREYYLNMFKSGNIPEACQNCFHVEEKDWDEEIGFKFISISSRTKCSSCDCFYCIQSLGKPEIKKELNTRQCWDIKPIIKELYNENLILKDCIYIIGGGEPTEFPQDELEYLMLVGLMSDVHILILTNGIIYNENIAKLLSVGKVSLKISIDAGTKATYQKIKRVNAYDKVMTNIKKYSQAAKNNPNGIVEAKYIICPGINDNLKEAKAFISKIKKAGCKGLEVALEYSWFNSNKNNPVNGTLRETLSYFREITKNGFGNFGDADSWVASKLEEK